MNTVHWFTGLIIHWYSQYIKLVRASRRLGAQVWWEVFSSRWHCQQKSGPGPAPAVQWAGGCFSTGQGVDVTWVGRSRTVDVSRGSSWALSCYCWAVGWCNSFQPGQIKWGTSDLPPDTPAGPGNVKNTEWVWSGLTNEGATVFPQHSVTLTVQDKLCAELKIPLVRVLYKFLSKNKSCLGKNFCTVDLVSMQNSY